MKKFEGKFLEADSYAALLFEGIYGHATVYVNGKIVYEHANGYLGFEVPLSGYLKAGKNEIVVEVDNSLEPNSRWYTGSGIYRPAYLIQKKKPFIQDVTIQTVSIYPAKISVLVKSELAADIRISNPDGKEIISCAQGKKNEPVIIEIPDAVLWEENQPYLYSCTITTSTDEWKQKFGIRLLEWGADKGFCVNEKSVKFRGGCIHHDNGVLGACEFADAADRKIRILKEQGYNAIRSAHNPCSEEILEACDKYGMYVIDEVFDGWYIPKTYHDYSRIFEKSYEADLKEMVRKDKNHPCVICYSIGNEVTETAENKGIELTGKMVEILHKADHTRPVTCGINPMLNWLIKRGF